MNIFVSFPCHSENVSCLRWCKKYNLRIAVFMLEQPESTEGHRPKFVAYWIPYEQNETILRQFTVCFLYELRLVKQAPVIFHPKNLYANELLIASLSFHCYNSKGIKLKPLQSIDFQQ